MQLITDSLNGRLIARTIAWFTSRLNIKQRCFDNLESLSSDILIYYRPLVANFEVAHR